jgi:hypothetical protein
MMVINGIMVLSTITVYCSYRPFSLARSSPLGLCLQSIVTVVHYNSIFSVDPCGLCHVQGTILSYSKDDMSYMMVAMGSYSNLKYRMLHMEFKSSVYCIAISIIIYLSRCGVLLVSLLMRMELGVMNVVLLPLQDYNVSITTHGILMIFFL